MQEIHKFTHGDMQCTIINDGYVVIQPSTLCFEGSEPEELAEEFEKHGISDTRLPLPCSILLVEKGDHKILVDCGSAGEMSGYDGNLGHLFKGLKEIGVSTKEITDVILTHGHFDHYAGCAYSDGVPRFPNATFYMAEKEWQRWAQNEGDSPIDELARVKLNGIKDQLELISPDAEILDGVHLLETPGHTMDHVSVVFESAGEILLCPIDVMDHHLQGQHPTWGASWDEDREKAIASRNRILTLADEKNALVHGFHFPFPGLGRFSYDGDVWQWTVESDNEIDSLGEGDTWDTLN